MITDNLLFGKIDFELLSWDNLIADESLLDGRGSSLILKLHKCNVVFGWNGADLLVARVPFKRYR